MPRGIKTLTEEHKQKMKAGRQKKTQDQDELDELEPVRGAPKGYLDGGIWIPFKRYTIKITGDEKTAFDFLRPLRITLRPASAFDYCRYIEREILNPSIWQDIPRIKEALKKYVDIEEGAPIKIVKPKKEKKTRAPLTEERKAQLKVQLQKARDVRKEKK